MDTFGQRPAILANDELRMFDVFGAIIRWQGQERVALVHQSDGKYLLGMTPLTGNRPILDATEDGDVSIEILE